MNAEIDASSYGTNATLTITSENNGSLEVSGSNHGIFVNSGTGNASLNIEKATVTSSTNGNYAAGVCVQSGASATEPPNISLAVDGGSLTASASEGNDGIQFYVGSSEATDATTRLTVSENAIVDARNGGISASRILETLPTPTPTGNNSSGIVFDDKNGTVYGTVELQNDLTINEGETLTVPDGSKLDCNNNLTNNGTILVSGGTVTGSLSGGSTTVTTPSISVQPQNKEVTAGETATFTVEASAGSETPTYQWQQSTDNGGSWANIESATSASYTISSTATDMSNYQYRCVVKSASGVGVISQAATLTVNKGVSPTSYSISANVAPAGAGTVKVNGSGTSATVTAGDEVTLAATANSGYRFVGWMEGDQTVSTDTTYAFQASSNRSLTAKFEKVYTVTVNASGGGTATGGGSYAEGETVTLSAQANQGYRFTGWTSSNGGTFADASSESTTFTMPAGDVTVTAGFTRISSGSTTPSKTPSQQATDKIEAAKAGDTVTVNLTTGNTKLNKEVFEKLSGKDVTLEIKLPGGVMWTVNGQDIPADADLTDLDMGVSMNTSTIPVNLINAVTGEAGTVQLTLKHNGEFGFKMMLTAPVGVKNAGLWANLYHYDEDAGKMVYQAAALVDEDGNVALPFDHASQYALVLDSKSHDLPFTDLAADAWYTDAVAYVYRHDLMAGYGENLFGPDDDLSRAQLCQIIYNMEGQPATSGSSVFTDVADSAWYADAVTWAASQGIVGGYGGGLFGPEDNITREQLASILYRYAQAKGYDVSVGEDTNILSYTDALEISEYAIPAMQWACGAGIIQGNGGYLDPQGNATRAEIATMLMRFCGYYT
ncbi:S-layer homology domain-containing protein [Agathobaculum sp. Marseille-P7918]|uniref:S-layer homology domain-containing protein n=1 Tax=Agathobaculum sp. Marseille-P7918 TaxID=2479843 RepID=UPI0013DD9168|nr:S-layer homology domain-containing protein [Agathobaculum sp. Marseille-P7918]